MIPIGALAVRTGVNIETIRYYERVGVLPKAKRADNGRRHYSEEDVRRLAFIRKSRDLGFTLPEVRTLLDLADKKDRSCRAVDRIAREHLSDIDRKISDLTALRRELASVISRCRQGTVAECRIIEALSPR